MLTEEEDTEIRIDEEWLAGGEKKGEFCLVGKLIANRSVKKDVIQRTLEKI